MKWGLWNTYLYCYNFIIFVLNFIFYLHLYSVHDFHFHRDNLLKVYYIYVVTMWTSSHSLAYNKMDFALENRWI